MQSLWNDQEAVPFLNDPLALRVYTSRLLGREPSLVLHGGGNTSVKTEAINLFGEREPIICVKGSGWDLATIEAAGFAPVRLGPLEQMAQLPTLTDGDMVRAQRTAMTDPGAPTPSVEAILHAILPFAYVDHTHADAVVAISNTPGGEATIREIYGPRVLVVPYVMPGFVLARTVYEMTRDINWQEIDGMILLNHGVFTFADDARVCYERMISLVTMAEEYIASKAGPVKAAPPSRVRSGPEMPLAALRKEISRVRGGATIVQVDETPDALAFAERPDVAAIATRGPLTPDHVIRTKPVPMFVGPDPRISVDDYASAYRKYFDRHAGQGLSILDSAPRWAVWPGRGTLAIGGNARESGIVSDIVRHTRKAIVAAEALGGWRPLGPAELFEVEYWELEQAKLKSGGKRPPLEGKVALVTGAASGIGRATAEMLHAQGASVVGIDINPQVAGTLNKPGLVGLPCDVTDRAALEEAVHATVRRFGGLDHLVSNAGMFTPSQLLAEMNEETWQKSLALNLTSHQHLFRVAVPYLRLGIDPAIIVIASKNVPAPGPGAGAYSVAKAGLTQLSRVAALELAPDGIRVNVIHPHAVFDTAAWTPDVLAQRAKSYGVSVEEYKAKNLLGVEITSNDVAALVLAMLGPAFAKTTGAQVPIDGGNERVI
jgi:rhamnose utilization protein RhaD (predicted bifunctional aldolase and dehydrogenase)/NAD(P)-dependent dehydrogenase (short-subunit alcohol dehydrogenase family)